MRNRTALLAAGFATALVAGGGTALGAVASSGPVSSSGVITGCFTNAEINGSHVFVLQDAGTGCPKGTTAVSWNEQRPAGATGPAGPAGASVLTSDGSPGIGSSCTTGDTDIDYTTGEVYTCPAAEWVDSKNSIAGPAGAAGATGPPGPAGPAGSSDIDGGQINFNPSASTICAVNSSFGPDTVTVTTGGGGCLIEGLPAGADVVVSLVASEYGITVPYVETLSTGTAIFGQEVLAGFEQSGVVGGGGGFTFNWIAVPTS